MARYALASFNDGAGAGAGMPELRSSWWFDGHDLQTFCHRGWLRPLGLSDEALKDRPIVGICNMWSELVGCNVHLRELAQAVKRGVLQAGGLPLEFCVMTPGDALQKPAAMMYRNLAAMEVEETIRSNPLDSVVLLAGCDKSVPASLMGAASADIPCVVVTGGPALPGFFRGQRVGSGSGYWRFADRARLGELTPAEYLDAEACLIRSHGHCMDMGTASTMACLTESLGLSLPGAAAVPAVDSRRYVVAERSGRRAVELAREDLRPSQILTPAAFANTIRVLEALAGSTNALIHLVAVAGRVGIRLSLEDFRSAADTPVLANIEPTGRYLMEDFYLAGGVQALIAALLPLLDGDALTVNGRTIRENAGDARWVNADVIKPLDDPLMSTSAHVVLTGNLAPDGAVLKRSAASRKLLKHTGPAVVFQDIHHLNASIDDPSLDVTEDSVLVLKNGGPRGAPGFPELGTLPIPERLLRRGVTDMVRISDSRVSGTTYGTIVCHVAPEAAAGGPIAVVQTGDVIRLDADEGVLEVALTEAEIAQRSSQQEPPPRFYERGYGALFMDHVLQAPDGADFDFLQNLAGHPAPRRPELLLRGWVSL
jgi:L-arabonate dehydrase